MATDKTVDYSITADPAGFEAGMKKAVESSKAARDQIEGHFGKIGDLFKASFGQAAAAMSLVGGGVYFKSAIDETKKLTGEANSLAKSLGISATEASILNVALGDVYSDAETFNSAAQKLAKTLRADEEALNAMGLETRTASGEYRNMNDLMLDSIKVLGTYNEGTDRNLAAMTMFGKGASEVAGLLKLNAGKIEEAREKAEALNLTISQEGVEANKRYKAAMNDLGDVMSGMKKTVGEILMPVFTELGEWFAQTGPAKIEIIKTAVQSLVFVFRVVEFGIKSVWRTAVLAFDQISQTGTAFAGVMSKLFSGDYAGALEEGNKAMAKFKETNYQAFVEVKSYAREADDKIAGMFVPKTAAAAPEPGKGRSYVDPKATGKAGKDSSIMGSLEEGLAKQKDAFERSQQEQGALREFGKAQERDYWKSILATTKLGENDRMSVSRKVLGIEHDLRKQGFEADIAASKANLENFRQDHVARIGILERIHAQMATMYGAGSKEEQEAAGEIAKEKRKQAEQELRIESNLAAAKRNIRLMEIDDAEAQAAFEVQTEQRSVMSRIQSLEAFELARFQIKKEALLAEQSEIARAEDFDREAMARNKAAREELEQLHQNRMGQIKRQAALETKRYDVEAFGDIRSGLQNTIAATFKGTQSIGGMFKAMFQSVVDAVANMLAKIATNWLMEMAREKIMGALGALSKITQHAAVAGAAAFASTAAIPIVGPAMAPAAGAAAQGAAMGFASFLPMASRGYDIPAGLNPLTQLHQKEMVLPAEQADVIRGLAGQGGSVSPIHFNVTAMDSRDVARFFDEHGSTIVKKLRQQQAKGA